MLSQDFCLETPPVMKHAHGWIQMLTSLWQTFPFVVIFTHCAKNITNQPQTIKTPCGHSATPAHPTVHFVPVCPLFHTEDVTSQTMDGFLPFCRVQYGPAFQSLWGSQEVRHYTPFIFLLFKWMNKKLFDFACQSSGSYIWGTVAIINHESDCKPWLSAAQEVVSLWCELAQEEMLQLE